MKVSQSKPGGQQLLCVKLGWREHFDTKELELLNTGAVDGLLYPYAVKGNKHNVLQYDISSFTTLQFYLSCILEQAQFVDLVQSCISIFKEMQRNYLHIDRLLSSFEQIFIQLVEKRVCFAYAPVMDWTGDFTVAAFFQRLIDQTTCGAYEFALFADQYRNFLRRPTVFSLHEFEAFIRDISSVGRAPEPAWSALSRQAGGPVRQSAPGGAERWHNPPPMPEARYIFPGSLSAAPAAPREPDGTMLLGEAGTVPLGVSERAPALRGLLVRQKTGEQFPVDHTPFVIGRESGRADLVIVDNPTIGRIHATITSRENGFFAADNGSVNKSYLEGAALEPGREYALKEGAHLRLSNEEFVFHIES